MAHKSPGSIQQSLWAASEYFAYPLMMFAATPLFLYSLGDAKYGQWMLLLTFAGFGGLGGLGMGPAATHAVAVARGKVDLAVAYNEVRACLAVSFLSSLLLAVLIFSFGGLLGDRVFSQMGSHDELVMITTFAAALIVIQQVDGVFASVLRGMERFNLSARIEMSIKFSLVIGALLAALATRGVLAVFIVAFVVSAFGAGVKGFFAARQLQCGPLFPNWSVSDMRKALGFGGWIWMQGLGSLIFSTADRLLVGSLLGASQLAYYSIALQLAQQIQTVPAAGAQVLFPKVALALERGDDSYKLAVNASFIVAAIAAALTALLLIFGDWLLPYWVGAERAAHVWEILPWLSTAFFLVALPTGAHFVLMGRGHVKFLAVIGIVAGLLSITVAAISLSTIGILGAVLGKVVYGFIVLLLIPKMFSTSSQHK